MEKFFIPNEINHISSEGTMKASAIEVRPDKMDKNREIPTLIQQLNQNMEQSNLTEEDGVDEVLSKEAGEQLGLNSDETAKFNDILEQSKNEAITKDWGVDSGGLVCITGSINCVGCYGCLINDDGSVCRNGS